MSVFTDYEKKVLHLLLADGLLSDEINEIIENAEFGSIKFTNIGYFLTIHHHYLPKDKLVFSKPTVIGEIDNAICGFMVFY